MDFPLCNKWIYSHILPTHTGPERSRGGRHTSWMERMKLRGFVITHFISVLFKHIAIAGFASAHCFCIVSLPYMRRDCVPRAHMSQDNHLVCQENFPSRRSPCVRLLLRITIILLLLLLFFPCGLLRFFPQHSIEALIALLSIGEHLNLVPIWCAHTHTHLHSVWLDLDLLSKPYRTRITSFLLMCSRLNSVGLFAICGERA